MFRDAALGTLFIVLGLGFISYITIRSRNTIKRIAERMTGTVREIMKDFQDGD